MGFLSAYSGTYRITIPHPDKEYWIDLKKHLTQGATEKAGAHMQAVTIIDGKPCPKPDAIRMRQELVLASIAGWNLDDDNGTVWPINLQSVRRLPEAVFERIFAQVEKSNEQLPSQERAQFPDEGAGGDPARVGGPAVAADVPDGAAAVAAPWAEA